MAVLWITSYGSLAGKIKLNLSNKACNSKAPVKELPKVYHHSLMGEDGMDASRLSIGTPAHRLLCSCSLGV